MSDAKIIAAGLEQCEFDDECDFCNAPEGGTFTRLIHNPEDVTEAEFYICNKCASQAITRVTQGATPKSNQTLPSMFWNSDDVEKCHSSIDELLNDEVCNGSLEVGSVFTIQRAVRMPDVEVTVTGIDDESLDVQYTETIREQK